MTAGTAAFTEPVAVRRLERAAAALNANGFVTEILDDVAAVTETGSVVVASAPCSCSTPRSGRAG
ncbi:hypothetical protein BLA60_35050 [Actinophytocola xinjiangensis]|uniref:Uncharacterized protein n=1 Tax=Actinophytocola xinjiangensis TaxID=485602 RepID=A0A7Z1AU82_9PSEU|nr:hypothetical protein [Actinophytocola xinjiangensis]OLF05731.1 hypothetical protein BLA60_35050 [Actinophytocola xinjiangensis]